MAERANVAISTVSRVVNGGRASKAVQRKVRQAIDELGYSPSVAAQSLVNGRAGCIGLVVNSSQSTWFSQILGGVEEALAPSRQSVLLASLMRGGQRDPSAVHRWIHERRVDGLLLVRYSRKDRELLDLAREAALPCVLLAPDLDSEAFPSVRSNNRMAGRLAAGHLIELGHRHLAFAGGPEQSVDTRMRQMGVAERCQESGIELASEDVWFGESYGHEAGVQFAEVLLRRSPAQRPTAVVLGNDPMAVGFVGTLLSAGVVVPRQVSVVGFDGTPDGERFWPRLTTVAQPSREMGERACRVLLEAISSPQGVLSTSSEYPVRLVVRDSTAPPRAD